MFTTRSRHAHWRHQCPLSAISGPLNVTEEELMQRPGMPLEAGTSIVRRALSIAAAAFIVGQIFSSQVGNAQQQRTVAQDIADIERQIDQIEGEAIA